MKPDLAGVKRLFPDVQGLHRRVDTLLSNSSIARIGLIPHASTRSQIKPVLECLVADPVADEKWHSELQNRPLTKDVLVTQSPSFDYVETRNSLVEYPVPFTGPSLEFIEATSLKDSWDHLSGCDLHLFCSTNAADALTQPISKGYPRLLVVDDDVLAGRASSPNRVFISTAKAESADDELRKGPSHISAYLEKYPASNIDELKKRVMKPVPELRAALFGSVIDTCEEIIDENKSLSQHYHDVQKKAETLRTSWASDAHKELQSRLLPALQKTLYRDLAWYKLYAKVDDVDTILQEAINFNYLPQTRANLEYVVGSLDTLLPVPIQQPNDVELPLSVARKNIMSGATALHNKALKQLLVAGLGVQLPLVGLAVAGNVLLEQSAYSMASVAALGLVAGAAKLQKSWLRLCQAFYTAAENQTLKAISQSDEGLWSIYESKQSNQSSSIVEQEKLLNSLKQTSTTGDNPKPASRTENAIRTS